MMDEQEQVRQEQDRHMHLLHRNVTGLRANLDLAQTVAATKVHNHLTDNQNLLKEVNNLRLEVRALSMENQRLIAQLDFNNRMQGGKRRNSTMEAVSADSASEPLFPQYHAQPHNGRVSFDHQKDSSLSGSVESSFAVPFGSAAKNGAGGIASAASLPRVEEGLSFDSNGLRSDAEFFNRMRTGVVAPPELAETVPILPTGPRGFAKKVSKSASTPQFKVHALHSDAAVEGARLEAVNAGLPQPTASVTSKRTISGVPSYASIDGVGSGSHHSGGGQVVNKNEFNRSADDKIAALIELNEQQIRTYKEELTREQGAAKTSAVAGGRKPDSKAGAPAAGPGQGRGGPLELKGATALSSSTEHFGSGGGGPSLQFPNIRKGSGASNSSKKR
jgi:hypothetical protein